MYNKKPLHPFPFFIYTLSATKQYYLPISTISTTPRNSFQTCHSPYISSSIRHQRIPNHGAFRCATESQRFGKPLRPSEKATHTTVDGILFNIAAHCLKNLSYPKVGIPWHEFPPAIILVGATMHPLRPCFSSKEGTVILLPQPRSRMTFATGLPAARR